MPRKSASAPMGSSSGATPAPSRSRSWSSVRSKLARSRSSLLTKIIRGTPSSAACRHTPRSAPRRRRPRSPRTPPGRRPAARPGRRRGSRRSPGVSIRLTLWPFHSNGATASDSEMPRRCSSGSWSLTVVPSSTRPSRLIAPARCKSASASVVLPAPPWPDQGHVADLLGRKELHSAPPRCRQLRVLGRVARGPRLARGA